MRMTYAAKMRAYHVQMYAICEERRNCGMDEAEWRRRCKEALENCDLSATPKHRAQMMPNKKD
jgi:hypothetical protein